jgi:hypothetical protein
MSTAWRATFQPVGNRCTLATNDLSVLEMTVAMSFSANRRCLVFYEAASSQPPTATTATLVFTPAFRRRGPLTTAYVVWMSPTFGRQKT